MQRELSSLLKEATSAQRVLQEFAVEAHES
jgi:hypothetical protein